jgi:NhaP-type Na+/H+ and K+/H+ antiporter
MGEAFPAIVYVLCFLTSAACAWLLGRSYSRSGIRLLLWSSISFAFLAANNLFLVLDLVVWPQQEVDLRLPRLLLALAAGVSLIWGFVWDVERD